MSHLKKSFFSVTRRNDMNT